MSYAGQRAAAQMERDGIRKLPRWTKGKKVGVAWMKAPVSLPHCEHQGCAKRAGYSTPLGNRCFGHALAARTPSHTSNEEQTNG